MEKINISNFSRNLKEIITDETEEESRVRVYLKEFFLNPNKLGPIQSTTGPTKCYGLNAFPQNSHVGALTPRTLRIGDKIFEEVIKLK